MTTQERENARAQLHADCSSGDHARQRAAYQHLWEYLYPIVYQILRTQPAPVDLAQDVTQQALVRIHRRLHECHSPGAFRTWCRRIATNLALDELRRRQRWVQHEDVDTVMEQSAPVASAEKSVVARLNLDDLRDLLEKAPVSERSRRVVIGRYLDDAPDEDLCQIESELAGQEVLPSHVQVTRSKNLAKLRTWPALRSFLRG